MIRPKRDTISVKSLNIIGIPVSMQSMTLKDLIIPSDKYKAVVDFVHNYINTIETISLANLSGICFIGSNGTGKTLLSSIILKEAYRNRYTCKRITFTQYITLYTNTWGNNDVFDKANSFETLNNIRGQEFLVLEEIGKEVDSKISAPILEDLLRYREDNGLVTIICTNSDVKNLTARYGDSIMSLIAGATIKITLTGTDFRKYADKSAMQGGLMSAT